MGSLVFQATLGGQVNLNGPNTASTFDIAVPATTGTMVTTGDSGTVTNTMLAGSIANAKLTNSSVTVGSTSIALGATSTTLDGVNIGATTAGTGAFTTLSASSTVSGTGFSTYLASPPAIGGTAAAAGSFTTLSASSTVSGTGFSTYLASPPAIGGTAAAAGTFTTLSGTTSVTTPIVKSASSLTLQSNGTTTAVTVDTSQNVGIGTTSPGYKLDVQSTASSGAPLLANFQAAGGDVQMYVQNGTVKTQITADNTNSISIVGSYSNHPLSFRTNNAERGRFDISGNFLFNSGYGSAVNAYGCRAWVNFNGTTASPSTIRGSGNVSSITKTSTGNYAINFTTNLVDTNYSVVASVSKGAGAASVLNSGWCNTGEARAVSNCLLETYSLTPAYIDSANVYAAVFR